MFLFGPPLSPLPPSSRLVGGPRLPGQSLLTNTQVCGFSVWLTLAAGRGRLTRYQQGKDIQPSPGQTTSGGCISMRGMNMTSCESCGISCKEGYMLITQPGQQKMQVPHVTVLATSISLVRCRLSLSLGQ